MINTAFVIDPFSEYTLSEEVEQIIEELKPLGFDIKPTLVTEGIYEVLGKSFELVIIDYGGMSISGAYDTAKSNVKYACKYAEDHPGCLLVIWSRYTADIYEDELNEEFSHLSNIIAQYAPGVRAYDFTDKHDTFIKKFKDWFSGKQAVINKPEVKND